MRAAGGRKYRILGHYLSSVILGEHPTLSLPNPSREALLMMIN